MKACQTVEDYCAKRSWRLRLRPADSRWLIRLAVETLPNRPPRAFFDKDRYQDWHKRLETRLAESVRQKYQNPVAVWVLLNVIVPIVVKLVLEWWYRRKEESP